MLSLWDLGLLLLAVPVAIAAPGSPQGVSTMTVPFSNSEDTAKTAATSAVALPSSKSVAPLRKGCQQNLRFTNFALYSDTGCKDPIIDPFFVTWNPCDASSETPPLKSGVIFQSVRWLSGSNAQEMYACQQGHSCGIDVARIFQQPDACSSGGGWHLDKIGILT